MSNRVEDRHGDKFGKNYTVNANPLAETPEGQEIIAYVLSVASGFYKLTRKYKPSDITRLTGENITTFIENIMHLVEILDEDDFAEAKYNIFKSFAQFMTVAAANATPHMLIDSLLQVMLHLLQRLTETRGKPEHVRPPIHDLAALVAMHYACLLRADVVSKNEAQQFFDTYSRHMTGMVLNMAEKLDRPNEEIQTLVNFMKKIKDRPGDRTESVN